jgi:hypothetical protein
MLPTIFADDTNLFASSKNIEELTQIVNSEFKKVTDFFRSNKLALHPEKTKVILFTTNQNMKTYTLNIKCNFNNDHENVQGRITNIEQILTNDYVKFLGVKLDPDLNFKHHIAGVTSKLSSALYAIRKTKNFLNEKSRLNLYYSLFHSHIVYANQIWSSASMTNLKPIIKLQKNAIRLVCGANINAHSKPLFKRTEVLPLEDLIFYFKSQFMFYYVSEKTPTIFQDTWPRRNRDNRLRRNPEEDDNFTPFYRLVCVEKLPYVSIPQAWRLTPLEAKTSTNIQQFNEKMKNYLINRISDIPECNRVFCPECANH